MENEIWKYYKTTFIGRKNQKIYEISNMGNVKINGILVNLEKHHKLRYCAVGNIAVHRAVAELFVPNPENKPFVDHINTDTYDNRAVNLRWVTSKENCNNPLTRQHMSASQKEAQNRPEVKEKHRAGAKEAQNRPEVKAKRIASFKETNKNPEVRAKRSASLKEANKNPETKIKRSNAMKGNKNRLNHTWMTNGIDSTCCSKELVDYYLERGYHLGRK